MNKNIKFFIFIILLIGLWFLNKNLPINFVFIEEKLKKVPLFLGGFVFIFLYVVITFFVWLSKDGFRFLSAVLFGPYLSTILVFIAEVINAFVLFYLARYLGRDFVERKIKGKAFYFNLDQKLTNLNFLWLILLRMVPLVPFRFLDLAGGLTGISFRRYLVAVILGSPLRIFWLQYILSGVGRAVFYDPNLLIEFLLKNKFLYFLTLLYIFLIIPIVKKLKNIR